MARYSDKEIEMYRNRFRTMPASLSVAECARQMGVAQQTLRNWIKTYEWERDLSQEVARRTIIATQKAILGMPIDQPLTDEEQAIAQRVALNIALCDQFRDWLTGFGKTMNELNGHLSQQVSSLKVAVWNDRAQDYVLVPLSLNNAIPQARNLMSTFREFSEEMRKAFGINDGGDNDDVDSALRALALEAEKMLAQDAPASNE